MTWTPLPPENTYTPEASTAAASFFLKRSAVHPEAVAFSVDVGRVWNFLTQDANAAMDRVGQPYIRFVLGHRLIMWTSVPEDTPKPTA